MILLQDDEEFSPWEAIQGGHAEVVRADSPLDLAVQGGHADVVRALIEAGADTASKQVPI